MLLKGVISGSMQQRCAIKLRLLASISAFFCATALVQAQQGFVVGSSSGSSQVQVFRGTSTTPTLSFNAFDPGFGGGVWVGSTDVNRDGVAELLVGAGAGGGPTVRIFESTAGTVLGEFNLGDAASRAGVLVAGGDLNGDGFGDVLAGNGGSPRITSAKADGTPIFPEFFAQDSTARTGSSVAVGDVDNNGRAEIITGTLQGSPTVRVFRTDTATPSLLYSFDAGDSSFRGGIFVAAGDIDRDGFSDIVTGLGSGGSSQVKVFSGRTGLSLMSFLAFDPAFSGGVRVGVADLNADGFLDIITGMGPGGGRVRAFSGLDQQMLVDFSPFGESFTGGVSVAGVVPEPSSALALLAGGAILLGRRRRD